MCRHCILRGFSKEGPLTDPRVCGVRCRDKGEIVGVPIVETQLGVADCEDDT